MSNEREISHDWIEKALDHPDFIEMKEDGTIHYICSIPERKGKFLRVVMNPSEYPNKVITLFFDRRIKR